MRIRALSFFVVLTFGLAMSVVACGGDDDDDDDDDDEEETDSECADGCVDNGDGTMTCECLMWKTDDNGAPATWDDARDWAEGLNFADRTGWRLPSVTELESLFDAGNPGTAANGNPTFIMDPFTLTRTEVWSGDLVKADVSHAYYVSYLLETGSFTGEISRTSTDGQSALAVLDLE